MPVRNLDRVQFEALRKQFDQYFNELHDELEEAYYNNWQHGSPQLVWGVLDIDGRNLSSQTRRWLRISRNSIASPEQAKQLFNRAHGELWHAHRLFMVQENERQGRLVAEDQIDPARHNEDGTMIERRSEMAKRRLKELRENDPGIDLPGIIFNRFGLVVDIS